MINSNTQSNTYDKSTLDSKFLIISDKLSELKQGLSLRVTIPDHNKDISNSITSALGSLPKHYVTYEELLVYLKDYIKNNGVGGVISIDDNTVTMVNNGELGLDIKGDKLSLKVTPPYVDPVVKATVNPNMIEYGQAYSPSPAVITVTVDDPSKITGIFITGGELVNEDITDTGIATDEASSTEPTEYTITYINSNELTSEITCSTQIGMRVLYGSVEPTADTFSTVANMKAYKGTNKVVTANPSSITISQGVGKYGWIATPWEIKSFTDSSIGFPGGWRVSEPTEYVSPYSDTIKYYVYRTENTNLGNVTWKITNK